MSLNTAHKTRRELLLGLRSSDRTIRPVGAINPYEFHDACNKCGDCARACPENIIHRDKDGYPSIDFAKSACTFCGNCTDACETGALVAHIPWPYRANVSQRCLSQNAVQCRVCQDQCDQRAIRFQLATGGRSDPIVNNDTCTGCGACVAPCPVQAITLQAPSAQPEV